MGRIKGQLKRPLTSREQTAFQAIADSGSKGIGFIGAGAAKQILARNTQQFGGGKAAPSSAAPSRGARIVGRGIVPGGRVDRILRSTASSTAQSSEGATDTGDLAKPVRKKRRSSLLGRPQGTLVDKKSLLGR